MNLDEYRKKKHIAREYVSVVRTIAEDGPGPYLDIPRVARNTMNYRECMKEEDLSPKIRLRKKVHSLNISLCQLFVAPWAYKWSIVLVCGILISAFCYFVSTIYPCKLTYAMYAIPMATCVPVAVLCLTLEWDVTNRTHWYDAALFATMGGGLAALIAGLLNNWLGIFEVGMFWIAALTEEPIKALVLILILTKHKRYPGILSGLTIGCAIGCGFAIIEHLEYAYMFGIDESPSVKVLCFRAFLSPMMHMAWTGTLGAALWAARGVEFNLFTILMDWKAWLIAIAMIVFHAFWNASGYGMFAVFALWAIILYYVKQGLVQAILHDMFERRDLI